MLILEKELVKVVGLVTGGYRKKSLVVEFQAPVYFVAYPYIIGNVISIITSQNHS